MSDDYPASVPAGRLSELDAVTLDAYGTLLELDDPVDSLAAVLPGRDPPDVERALRAEIAYYRAHCDEGRDQESLAALRTSCTAVFNEALGSSLAPEQFVAALRYRFLPGALEAVATLRARGLALAVVANWDASLEERLEPLGIPVVTSAAAGVAKPDPRIFALALQRLNVEAGRALHVGDDLVDEEGARAAGMGFAPAPLSAAVRELV